MSIKILPQNLINKIAAGEVVERPSSVVKELVENSLDAGAQNITIEIINGGINLIKVSDDGVGMDRNDARLSVALHATSKIYTEQDLFNISSLGFRGEALASISAVSEFTLKTKTKESLSGVQIFVKENQMTENEIGCADGTVVEVKNLFENVPARKKFLKTSVTEFNHIVDLFLNFVLANKKISWKLIHNSKLIYHFSAVDDLSKRSQEVFGRQIADNLLPINFNGVEVKVSGYVGRPQIARHNKKLQYVYVNGRAVSDYIICAKVKDAFGQNIFHNLYPVFILFINVDTQKVDINVHPRKMEVRFSEPQKVYMAIYRAVTEILDQTDLNFDVTTPERFVDSLRDFRNSKPTSMTNQNFQKRFFSGNIQKSMSGLKEEYMKVGFVPDLNVSVESERQGDIQTAVGKIIGQIKSSYIIVETENSMKIYDQHAVSERVQYQKIKDEFLQNKIAKQQLLIPENIEMIVGEAVVIKDNIEVFEKFGFDLSELSSNVFMINAVPQILAQKNYKEAVKELVGKMIEFPELSFSNEINEAVDKILKIMSCKSAIKFGDKLTFDEMSNLLGKLQDCDNKYTCVHGRPNVMEYRFDELEKLFKRKG